MKKFAIAAATATALTLTMANGAFAAEPTQAPVMLAANTVDNAKQEGSDTWITTKVKADLLTEKGIPGSDIKSRPAKASSRCRLTWRSLNPRKKKQYASPRTSKA